MVIIYQKQFPMYVNDESKYTNMLRYIFLFSFMSSFDISHWSDFVRFCLSTNKNLITKMNQKKSAVRVQTLVFLKNMKKSPFHQIRVGNPTAPNPLLSSDLLINVPLRTSTPMGDQSHLWMDLSTKGWDSGVPICPFLICHFFIYDFRFREERTVFIGRLPA